MSVENACLLPSSGMPLSPCKYASCTTNYDIDKILRGQALIRGFIIRRRFQKLVNQRIKRFNIARELLETERTYVAGLDTVIKTLDKLRKEKSDSKQEPLLTSDQIYTIFSNIRNIYDINSTLLVDLETRVVNWKSKEAIGDIFISMSPFFKSYTYYCQNYDSAIATLRHIRSQNAQFDSFINRFQVETKQSLQTMLITPVQRIPRYILLLNEMTKVTYPEHPDFNNLKRSIEQLDSITQKVNHGIEFAESVTKVVNIQNELASLLPDGVTTLVKAGRYFVRDGLVQFCNLDSRTHKQYKDHWLFLFNDALLYVRYKYKEGKDKYSNCGIMNFELDLKLKDIEDMQYTKNMFFIITSEKTFTLKCSSLEEKKKWMQEIQQLYSNISQNLKSLSPLSHFEKENENSLSISIVGTVLSHKKNKEYTNYMIKVSRQVKGRGTTEAMVSHRYRDFDRLRKTLESKLPVGKKLMDLPSKHLIGNLHKDIVESRRIMLQSFLEEVLLNPILRKQPELLLFLNLPLDFFDPFAQLENIGATNNNGPMLWSTSNLQLPTMTPSGTNTPVHRPRKYTLDRLFKSKTNPVSLETERANKSPPQDHFYTPPPLPKQRRGTEAVKSRSKSVSSPQALSVDDISHENPSLSNVSTSTSSSSSTTTSSSISTTPSSAPGSYLIGRPAASSPGISMSDHPNPLSKSSPNNNRNTLTSLTMKKRSKRNAGGILNNEGEDTIPNTRKESTSFIIRSKSFFTNSRATLKTDDSTKTKTVR